MSAFFARAAAAGRGVAAVEESLAGLATLARGLRTFLTVSSTVIEPAEYALGVEKTQICGDDAQGAVATGYREPHTYPMLGLGWVVFVAELLLALFFGALFWHFWTRSAMSRSVAKRAIFIYAAGCIVFLLLTLFLPL